MQRKYVRRQREDTDKRDDLINMIIYQQSIIGLLALLILFIFSLE